MISLSLGEVEFFSWCSYAVELIFNLISLICQHWYFALLFAAGFVYVALDLFQQLFFDPGDDYDDKVG